MKLPIKKLLFATLLATISSFAGFGMQQVQAADQITDCSTNSIIKCGVSSASDLISTIKADTNADKPGDLKAIYDRSGLPAANYDKFVKEAKIGTAKMNGDVVVDGKVVSRDSWSLGRNKKSFSDPFKIGDKTYYRSSASEVLKQDLPVLVWFDSATGRPAMVVMMACGNPVGGKPVTPSYTCKELQSKAVKGEANTYQFTTDAPLTGSAAISKVVYHFGDGTKDETRLDPKDAVTHTFKKAGTFKAKVTVYVKLPNGKEIPVNGDGCVKTITVKAKAAPKEAAWQCTGLQATAKARSDDEYSYTLRANATATNATLVSGTFDFGDGTSQQNVKPADTDDKFIAVNHTYKGAGTYTAKASLTFKANQGARADNGDSETVTCAVTISIKKPEQTVTPAVTTTSTPPAVLGAVTPIVAELPATGPVGVAGLFTGATVLGAVGHRWRARRRLAKVDDLVDRLQR